MLWFVVTLYPFTLLTIMRHMTRAQRVQQNFVLIELNESVDFFPISQDHSGFYLLNRDSNSR